MSETSNRSSMPNVVILARHYDGVWECDVYVDGVNYGGGTSPHGFLDTAADILYGDTNDHLNGYRGVLGELEAKSGV